MNTRSTDDGNVTCTWAFDQTRHQRGPVPIDHCRVTIRPNPDAVGPKTRVPIGATAAGSMTLGLLTVRPHDAKEDMSPRRRDGLDWKD